MRLRSFRRLGCFEKTLADRRLDYNPGLNRERTFELAEDAVNGAGAAAAGHGDVELVGVRHVG